MIKVCVQNPCFCNHEDICMYKNTTAYVVHSVQLDLNLKKLVCELHAARHYMSLKILIACLRALGKVMTSPPLVESKHTCYKLVTSLSSRARNVNALDTYHTEAPSTGACIPSVRRELRMYLPYNSLGVLTA